MLAGWGQEKVLLRTQICPEVTDEVEKKVQNQRVWREENGSTRLSNWTESRETPLFRKWKGIIPGDKRNDEK